MKIFDYSELDKKISSSEYYYADESLKKDKEVVSMTIKEDEDMISLIPEVP